MFSRILIAVDSSEPAQRAVELGGRLAAASAAAVKLIHVIHPIAPFIEGALSEELPEQEGERLLTKLRNRVPTGVVTEHQLLSGVPAEQIATAARSWDADLVVVGDHNRQVLSRFLLGSVADGVVRHAPCSVLVVREKDQQSAAAKTIEPAIDVK